MQDKPIWEQQRDAMISDHEYRWTRFRNSPSTASPAKDCEPGERQAVVSPGTSLTLKQLGEWNTRTRYRSVHTPCDDIRRFETDE